MEGWLLDVALEKLTLGRICFFRAILDDELNNERAELFAKARAHFMDAVEGLRHAGDVEYLPSCIQSRSWLRYIDGDMDSACADLDEAWDIAERSRMRLHMADIHLHRARLFFRAKVYPWKSPQDDPAVAENLINDCGYHRRDEELADAKRVILQS